MDTIIEVKKQDCCQGLLELKQENSTEAEIARYESCCMPLKCKTPHYSIVHRTFSVDFRITGLK